ncbi:Kef-type K+ transport system, membrane component [Synechococcus sp. PCC 7502]|uniref:cation:proton antiporter n=1 Tax=Synechococcus sp. PCC 7502 TaxID=1173263 RepID=UPI00029FBABC|nr:cation:proton antiporter [Synechococcus sp. PCC 7502]AFY73986.1 Kef-type K+ transport system, membrane component [Synechococcus sp. PCC 7502]
MEAVVLVLFEILIIIGLSRLVGLGFRLIKQPLVIGEIVAGILLGPSLLGLINPKVESWLFPTSSIPFLNVLAQVGLIFFMFLIGLELNPKYLRGQGKVAVLISNFSILLPFLLGSLLSVFLYPLLSESGVNFAAFCLFMGSAMSITAFPVLARIITEKNLQNTPLGNLALTCAAVDDVTAWCLLAMAIAVATTNTVTGAISTIVLAVAYITLMLTVGRKFLSRLDAHYERTKRISQSLLAVIYMGVLISALITELIGIHLIFGAFLLGVIMPKNEGLMHELSLKTEEFVLIFLLPIFFAYSGLRTQIGLLNTPQLWLICGLILVVAIAGKFFGTYVAARMCQVPKHEATILGWLMNTRGLTELIVLNIGLNLKVISPVLFTMLVIMALVTTFMTSPLLDFIHSKPHIDELGDELAQELNIDPNYQVLVPVTNPNTERGLIAIATAIALHPQQKNHRVYPFSLVQVDADNLFQNMPTETENNLRLRRDHLTQVISTIEPPSIRQYLNPIAQICQDVALETVKVAADMNLIVMGWHKPVFSNNRLGGKVGEILRTAPVDIAVFLDSDRGNLHSLLVPYGGDIHDDLALELGIRILGNLSHASMEIMVINPSLDTQISTILAQLPQSLGDRIVVTNSETEADINEVVSACSNFDLTITGITLEGQERQTLGIYGDELALKCQASILIVRKFGETSGLQDFLSGFRKIEARIS